jgi:uncharacterized membrane protein
MANDDTAQDQTAYDQLGLTPQQRSLIGYNTIGSIGALLLAAGQKMSPQDRAKYLAQLGNVPTQMSQQIDAATQSRVRQQQLAQIAAQAALMKGQLANLPIEAQLKQAQAAEANARVPLTQAQAMAAQTAADRDRATYQNAIDWVNKNENNLPAEMRGYAKANPQAFLQAYTQAQIHSSMPVPTDKQREIQALITQGVDPRTAIASVYGLVTVQPGPNGVLYAVDKLRGEAKPIGPTGPASFGLAPAGGAPAGGASNPGILSNGNSAQVNPYPNSSIHPNLPYGDIFGVGGAVLHLEGKAQDILGNTMSRDAGAAAQAAANYNLVRQDAIRALAVDMPGRNTKVLNEQLRSAFPKEGNVLTGRSGAYKQLTAVQAQINSEIANLRKIIDEDNIGYSSRQKQAAATNLQDLFRVRDNLGVMLNSMNTAPPLTSAQAKPVASAPSEARSPAPAANVPRRASDGNLYVPDPERPGQYLRLD